VKKVNMAPIFRLVTNVGTERQTPFEEVIDDLRCRNRTKLGNTSPTRSH